MKSQLLSLYQQAFGFEPEGIIDLRADGSNRRIYRIVGPGGTSAVGVVGPDYEENRAFLSFTRSLHSVGLPVPAILGVDEDAGMYIVEDLGDTTLFDALSASRAGDEFPEDIVALYKSVVRLLPEVQVKGGEVIDYSVAYPCAEFDRRSMTWDLNYFKYHYLKLAHIPFNEARLERDFDRLCDFLLEAGRSHFLYRDFQSRNIMIRDGRPYLIDYQGGRRGALQYDIASLLYDAKAALPEPLRDILLGEYLDALAEYTTVDRTRFVEHYRGFVLIRIMQAMGAYGYRGFFERKPHFLASVTYAIANIAAVMKRGLPVDVPELALVFERIMAAGAASGDTNQAPVDMQASADNAASEPVPGALTVTITSFSYRRGYPETPGSHGGGFVFDCRAIHNPGRYEPYMALCGRDREVIEFLEREQAVPGFWESVRGLVDNAVDTYLERGFTDLAVSFGCTGGQHRSVYFAERLARHLREQYPGVSVVLRHREEERWKIGNMK